ncbi:MAG: hypothetical protein ABEJ87_06155 [Candidatus Nanohalobium sp.]
METTLLMQTLASVTLGIFTLNLIFVYMTSSSSRRDLKWFYPLTLSLAILAASEFIFALNQASSGGALPWFSSLENIQVLQDVLYLTAGTSTVFFLKSFRYGETEE